MLADNSDKPFEHLQAEEAEDEVYDSLVPVHPYQQRILDLKSTTALLRQASSIIFTP